MTGKNDNDKWSIRKNKAGMFYYMIMIVFALFMFLILLGIYNTDVVFFWWQT